MRRKDRFRYITQGWGLTNDGKQLLMSNGSSAIVVVHPKSFEVVGWIFVSDNIGPVGFLNELLYADGKLYANVWQTDFIAIIAPNTGRSADGLIWPASIANPAILSTLTFSTDLLTTTTLAACW